MRNKPELQLTLPRSPAPVEVSLVEARNALRCPRIFALGRAHQQPVGFPQGSSSLGALFHRIVERFALELAGPPEARRGFEEGATREQMTRLFSAWLLGYLVVELKANAEVASMPSEVDDLAEALRKLAASLALLAEGAGKAPLEALRPGVESAGGDISATLERPSGAAVRLVGRARDLIGSAKEFLIVEYKLAEESNQDLDQTQAAIYRALLKQSLGLDMAPALLRYNPRLLATRISLDEADKILASRVSTFLEQLARWDGNPASAPMTTRRDLCAACPLRKQCREMFPDRVEARDNALAGAVRLVPDAEGKLVIPSVSEPAPNTLQDVSGRVEADELGERIRAELKAQGVGVTIKGKTVGSRFLQIEVICPGERVTRLDRAAVDVEHRLSHEEVRYERKHAKRFFWAPRKVPRAVDLATLLTIKKDFLCEKPGRFVVGEGLDGEVLTGDLSDGSACHLLIGGQTGSGKSVLLQALISSLCHYQSPSMIRFTLVDPKRVTFGKFAASVAPHLTGPIIYDVEALVPVLDDLVAEMESRYVQMEECQAQNIDDYNAVNAEKLGRRVVVVDEFQDLLAFKALRQPFLDAVKRLGAKARAAGIHLILATQRPDKNTVPGEIKANLCGRIALRVQEAVNSRILLDQGGAETLLGRGDLYANLGHGLVRAQAPMV